MDLRYCLALALAACTTGSPLSQLDPQVEIQVDPTAGSRVALTLTTWVDLATLRDAALTVTLDGQPLVVDQTTTGTFGAGDRYVAGFMTPAVRASSPASSASPVLSISDGETTWSATIENMMANDLIPTGPLVAGRDVFEWPSAASPTAWSTIAWACVEVVNRSAACDGDADPAVSISQQYITATIAGAAGEAVEVTGERHVNAASSGNGPTFLTHILAHYTGVLQSTN